MTQRAAAITRGMHIVEMKVDVARVTQIGAKEHAAIHDRQEHWRLAGGSVGINDIQRLSDAADGRHELVTRPQQI